MAQKRVLVIEDDIEGGPADHTVRFSLEGDHFEIDLNAQNAAEMREAFAPYVGRGRRLNRARTGHGRRVGGSGANGMDNRAIRDWAASRGIEIRAHGRIPARVLEQYRADGDAGAA